MADNTILKDNAGSGGSATSIQKWGATASFLTAVALIGAPLVYLTGNLDDTGGPVGRDSCCGKSIRKPVGPDKPAMNGLIKRRRHMA